MNRIRMIEELTPPCHTCRYYVPYADRCIVSYNRYIPVLIKPVLSVRKLHCHSWTEPEDKHWLVKITRYARYMIATELIWVSVWIAFGIILAIGADVGWYYLNYLRMLR